MTNEPNKQITLFIATYNQEDFIEDAIRGAFAQEGEPIDILISDDCSTDSTFAIIQQLASEYDGKHRVRIRRNNKNSGFIHHINIVMKELPSGLVIINAGDDISFPNRVNTIRKAWKAANYGIVSFHSDVRLIDESGKCGSVRKNVYPSVFQEDIKYTVQNCLGIEGATHAWHTQIFKFFGDLNKDVFYEDKVIPFRSALLGEVSYIPETLVYYRVGSGITKDYRNITLSNRVFGREAVNKLNLLRQQEKDLATFDSNHSLMPTLIQRISYQEFKVELSKLSTSKDILKLFYNSLPNLSGNYFGSLLLIAIKLWPSLSNSLYNLVYRKKNQWVTQ